jgi:hypothetical protein
MKIAYIYEKSSTVREIAPEYRRMYVKIARSKAHADEIIQRMAKHSPECKYEYVGYAIYKD